jgi:hypothetical protein
MELNVEIIAISGPSSGCAIHPLLCCSTASIADITQIGDVLSSSASPPLSSVGGGHRQIKMRMGAILCT